MREIKRVLRPDGVLIISSPDKYEFTDIGQQSTHYHVKELYRDEFEKLLYSSYKNVVIAGQRVVSGSAIFFENASAELCNYCEDQLLNEGNPGLPHPLYFIAVASDGKLCELPSGILETSRNYLVQQDELLHQRNLEVLEKDEKLNQQNLEVLEKNKQLHQRNLEVLEKDKQLHLLNLELHQRNLEFLEKDKQLHQRNLDVIEKDKQLHQLYLEVASLEEALRLCNRSLLEKLKDRFKINN